MAEEKKEALKIEAQLDTSKLKQQAQQGMQSVVNEAKKVENQSKQTSKAVDEIGQKGKDVGNALQQAGSAGTQAIKQIGQEADKTSQKIDEIAKATKNINLGRAFSVASQVANSDFGKAIGSDIGNSLGLSNSAQGLAGGALTGALSGAAMGAAFGPLGAAGGALLGAASGLIQAANAQKEAARELAKSGERRAQGILNQQLRNELNQYSEEEYKRIAENPYETVRGNWYPNGEEKEVTAIQGAIDKLKWQMEGYRDEIDDAAEALRRLDSINTSGFDEENMRLHNASIEEQAKIWEDYSARLEDAKKRLAAYIALQERLNNLPVGPEIPEYLRAQRDAEEQERRNAETKAKAEAEAKAKEEYNRQKAFDTYTIEQKKEKISSLQDTQLKPLESMMSGMASFRLTDSLTKIGGGAGYGVQMQGINRYVSSISNNIQTIKGIIQQELDAIRELSNKYKPYYGEFMAQQDN